MLTVFSQISAVISPEFVALFPAQFNFYRLLNKLCEDVSVTISSEDQGFTLQGDWQSLSSVQNMLISSYAVFGTCSSTVKTESLPQNSIPFSALVEAAEAMSRDVEIHENILKESTAQFSLSNEHDYVAQLTSSPENVKQCEVESSSKLDKETFLQSDIICEDSNTCVSEGREMSDVSDESRSVDCGYKETISDITEPDPTQSTELTLDFSYSTGMENVETGKFVQLQESTSSKSSKLNQLFTCNKCSYTSKIRYYMVDHVQNKHNHSPVKCQTCDKVFVNMRYLKHHQVVHEHTSFTCEICGRKYKCRKAFKAHLKTHAKDYVKEEHQCDECDKSFSSTYNLEAHRRSEHQGIAKKKFLCQTCGKSFTTKHTMQQHLNTHSGARPYVCGTCGKNFAFLSALRDHKNTHEKSKIFTCDFPACNKKFYQRSALKIHKAIHKESKDFVCGDCGRGFTQKQALQRHERAHKGLKPLICKFCLRSFGDHSVIRRHIQLVHKCNKDVDRWREDIIEAKMEENAEKHTSEHSVSKEEVENVNEPSTTVTIPTVVYVTNSKSKDDIFVKTETPDSNQIMSSNSMQVLMPPVHLPDAKTPTKHAASSVVMPAGIVQYQLPMPNFETAFLMKPAQLIQLQRGEVMESDQYVRPDVHVPVQDKEHVQFFSENLDGTFTSVEDTSQKIKVDDAYFRQGVPAEAGLSPEQLKPDGTLAETNLALQDDTGPRFGETELTTESLTQFYTYCSSLASQLSLSSMSAHDPHSTKH